MSRPALLALLLLAGCPSYEGPQPNATSFWQLETSTLEFGDACSDAPDFRQGLRPIEVTANTFLIYKVSADGKTAALQDCTRLDTRTCAPSDAGVTFAITGRELTWTESARDPIGTTGCALQQTATWTLTDATRTMTLDISNVLTLVDAPAACDRVEADLRARSPNMKGVEGCVLVNRLSGELR